MTKPDMKQRNGWEAKIEKLWALHFGKTTDFTGNDSFKYELALRQVEKILSQAILSAEERAREEAVRACVEDFRQMVDEQADGISSTLVKASLYIKLLNYEVTKELSNTKTDE